MRLIINAALYSVIVLLFQLWQSGSAIMQLNLPLFTRHMLLQENRFLFLFNTPKQVKYAPSILVYK